MDSIKIGFIPITYKVLENLYPETKETTNEIISLIKDKLKKIGDTVLWGTVGDEEEARKAAVYFRNKILDVLVIWENGYVPSSLPYSIVKYSCNTPIILFCTQRDKEVVPEMTYARYMQSTSFTGLIETGAALLKANIPYKTIVGHYNEEYIYKKLNIICRAASLKRQLQDLIIGYIGYPYPGMMDIDVDDMFVHSLGPSIKRITLQELSEYINNISPNRIKQTKNSLLEAIEYKKVKDEDINRAFRLYCAYEDIIKHHNLGSLCVHDYECVSTISETISDVPLSFLEREYNISTGVEGDLPNTIGAFITKKISGQSPMFCDWTMFDENLNAIFFQHNGKANPDIVHRPALSPSAEPFGGVKGEGVVFEAVGLPGAVTIVSMTHTGKRWRLFTSEGEAIKIKPRPCRLNQIMVKIDKPVKEYLENVANIGLSHHVNIGYGHFATELKYFAEFNCIEYLNY
jgi:L-arabinose isomerase